MRWVMDVPCPIDIVLGTTTVKVRECATLAVDTVIRLKQAAGSDLEVRVGGIPMFAVRSNGQVYPIMPMEKLRELSA